MKIKNLSIFIFAYNEAGNLPKVVESTVDFINSHVENGELIVVNDGSTDNSLAVLQDLSEHYSFRLINHEANMGIGLALTSGYSFATKEWVVGIPGDGQFNINELLEIKEWNENTFYSFYRKQKDYDWYRSFLTSFNKLLISLTLNNKLKDVNWIKVYSKKQLELANPTMKSSLIESEISSKLIKRGYFYDEIPSEYCLRMAGTPKGGNIHTVTKALLEMLKLINVVRKF